MSCGRGNKAVLRSNVREIDKVFPKGIPNGTKLRLKLSDGTVLVITNGSWKDVQANKLARHKITGIEIE